MKTSSAICSAAVLLFAAVHARADILTGPITNPANGHEYYLLTPDTWTTSEAEAERLGGTLAIVQNAAEQEWIFSTFGAYGGTNHSLWIGLRRQWPGGPFAWATDAKVGYLNWDNAQPDNADNCEDCVEIYSPLAGKAAGRWNDARNNRKEDDSPICGVVEVPGKSDEKALTEQEKPLVGAWYNNGDPAQPCWIAGTDSRLFAVDQNNSASRAIYTTEGLLFFPNWKQHAEIIKDRILWSRGNWWSRQPVGYKTGEASPKEIAGAPMIDSVKPGP
jgi:hypothetical protein